MPGPYLDPKKAAEFEQGFNSSGVDPVSIANKIAQKLHGASVGAEPEQTPEQLNAHMKAMEEAAKAAKQKYMHENNVDEDGQPL